MIGIANEECLLHLQGCPFFGLQADGSIYAAAGPEPGLGTDGYTW